MKPEIRLLHLAAPLITVPGERLYCFGLDPLQALEFEPDGASFIKSHDETFELPQGHYLFSQTEGLLPHEEVMEMALELQKEGLWQRLTPGLCFYLRYLHEDGRDVSQVFRPYNLTASTI